MSIERKTQQGEALEPVDIRQRLVPPGFGINVRAEIARGAKMPYPGYPSPEDRIHMTPEAISGWKLAGMRTADLPIGKAAVVNHPNYHSGLAKGRARIDDGEQKFDTIRFQATFYEGGYQRDERGLPIRPHDEIFLEEGAVEGIGFYWDYGPNRAADSVVFKEKDGKLQMLAIRRMDTGTLALPGGMVDPQEPDVSAALRELLEEAGIDLRDSPYKVVHRGIVWADPRATRHAWPESTVTLVMPDPVKADELKFKPQAEEVREVVWMDVTSENIDQLSFSHPSFVMLAAEAWQQEKGLVIANDGRIGTDQ